METRGMSATGITAAGVVAGSTLPLLPGDCCALQVSGTPGTLALAVEATLDDPASATATWTAISLTPQSGAAVTSVTANGLYQNQTAACFQAVRINVTSVLGTNINVRLVVGISGR